MRVPRDAKDREISRLKRVVRDLCRNVEVVIANMDVVGKMPASVERGRHYARVTNDLEMAKDLAKLAVGLSLKKKLA